MKHTRIVRAVVLPLLLAAALPALSYAPAPALSASTLTLRGAACTASYCLAVGNSKSIWMRVVSSRKAKATSVKSGSSHALYAAACDPGAGTTCVAVGTKEGIQVAGSGPSNGGNPWSSATWNPSSIPGKPSLYGVSCPDQQDCYAVGAKGAIARSGSSGTQWLGVSGVTNMSLYSISCSSSTQCMAVGEKGIVVVSTGYQSWQAYGGTGTDLYGVSCAPGGAFCMAVGQGGVIRTSTGISGQLTPIVTSPVALQQQDLYGVACPATTFCEVVGAAGTDLVLRPQAPSSGGAAPAAWTVTPISHGSLSHTLYAVACTPSTATSGAAVAGCLVVGSGRTFLWKAYGPGFAPAAASLSAQLAGNWIATTATLDFAYLSITANGTGSYSIHASGQLHAEEGVQPLVLSSDGTSATATYPSMATGTCWGTATVSLKLSMKGSQLEVTYTYSNASGSSAGNDCVSNTSTNLYNRE